MTLKNGQLNLNIISTNEEIELLKKLQKLKKILQSLS